ncbi:Non-classical arabinogalactan protein 31-like [Balamuthia mandrillaris]
MSPDNLVPNKKLRDAVDSYKRTISSQKNTEPLLPSEQAPQAQQLKERELEEEMKANNEESQMAQDHLPPTEMVTPLPPLYEDASSLAANTSEVAAVTSGTPIDHNHEDTHFKPTSPPVHAQTSAEVPENMMSGTKEDESEVPSDHHHHDGEKRQTEDYARGPGRGMPEHYRPDHMHGNGPPIHMPYPHGPPIHISHYPPHHPYHPHHHHHHHHHPHIGPTGSHYPMHQGPYGPPGIPGYSPFEEAGHGHYSAEVPYMQAARGDRLCYKCGHPGHVARACPASSPSNYEHEGRYSRTRERSDSRDEADLEWRRGREADSTGKARSRSPARRHSRLRSPSPKEHRSRHQSPRRTSRERRDRSRERYSPSHREHSTTKRSRSPRSRSRSRSQKRRITEKAEDKRDHQEKDKRLQRDRADSTTHGEGEKRKRDKAFDERERESRPKSKEERHKHSKPDQTVMKQRSERDKDSRVHLKEERPQTSDTKAISRLSAERKVKRETQHDVMREKRPSDTKHQAREESKTRKERQTPTNGEAAKENKKRRSGDPRSNSPHAHVSAKHTEDQRPSKRSRTSEKQRPTSPVQTRDHRDKKREKDIPAVAQQSKGTRVKESKNLPTATKRGVEGDTPKLNRRTSTKKENNEERSTNPKERSDRQPAALNTRHSPSTSRHKLSGSDDNKQVTSSSRKASQPIHKTQADKSSKSGAGSAHDGQADGASHKPGKKRRVVEDKPLQNARPSLPRSTNPATSVFSESRMRSDFIGQQAKPSGELNF